MAYKAVSADVDESTEAGELAADYVVRIAASKVHWVAARETGKLPVLAADTAVVLRGNILGKPVDVEEARRMLASRRYQLCLTDMRLPDGEGLDLVRHIAETVADLPVAVITAHGSAENAVSALKAGAFDYIAKPVSLEQLRGMVKSALDLPNPHPAGDTGDESGLLGEKGRHEAVGGIKAIRNGKLTPHCSVVARLFFGFCLGGNRHASDRMLQCHDRINRTGEG